MKALLRLLALAGTLGLLWPAQAQTPPYFPQTLPSNTVVGRLGGGSAGPAEAIPFTTLWSQLTKGSISTPIVTPQQYGAIGDGVHDDTAAIVAAIAASQAIYLPCGTYLISGSGAEVFLITNGPFAIVGAASGTNGGCVLIEGTIGNSTDLFHIRPGNGIVARGFIFSNFAISVTGGNAWFDLDATVSTSSEMAEVDINHVWAPLAPVSSNSVYLNGTSGNATGGTFNSYIHHNSFTSNASNAAIGLQFAGDSIRISDNILTGPGYGVLVNSVPGAAGLLIHGNNISAACPIIMLSVTFPVIAWNEIEQTRPQLCNALISGSGSTHPLSGVSIVNNSLSTPGNADTSLIALDKATNTHIDGNAFDGGGVSTNGIAITANATGTSIGCTNSYAALTTNISDSGSGTLQCLTAGTSITGSSGTQTFTNSPCATSLTTERWLPITVPGQTGTWYIPACH